VELYFYSPICLHGIIDSFTFYQSYTTLFSQNSGICLFVMSQSNYTDFYTGIPRHFHITVCHLSPIFFFSPPTNPNHLQQYPCWKFTSMRLCAHVRLCFWMCFLEIIVWYHLYWSCKNGLELGVCTYVPLFIRWLFMKEVKHFGYF
jgi:hypothetical protein